MAPSASMLFLSYHQLHRPTTAEAGAPPPPRREEEPAPGSAGFRMSVRSVLSLAMFQRRPEAAVPAVGTAALRERDGGVETRSSAATVADANNKELESKFEEALRLSCWSS